jgi:hypothetical protein
MDSDCSEACPLRTISCWLCNVGRCAMCGERSSSPKDFHVKIRSADLDAPTLVDQISADLLDHLIACRRCLVVFAAQEHSVGEAGCVEGRRISSQTKLRLQERRSSLALQHLTEQTVDDYLFDRLSCDEQQPLAHHLSCCLQCAETIEERKTLATWIRTAFDEESAQLRCKAEQSLRMALVSIDRNRRSSCQSPTT